MEPVVFALVAGAAVLHVTWNVLLKTAGDPFRAAVVGMSAAAALIVPAAGAAWLVSGRPPIPAEVVGLAALSGALEAAYFWFLSAAYRRGDLSVVYPIARGTAPLLAVGAGIVVLGERLGPQGLAGVAVLLVGLLALQRPWRIAGALRGRSGDGDAAAGFALVTGVTIAAYSAVDRVGVQAVEPWLYAGLMWAFAPLFLWVAFLLQRERSRRAASGPDEPAPFDIRRAAAGGVVTLTAYLLVLGALSVAPLTVVAPLRESAVVLASGWGMLRLGEGATRADGVQRLAASVLVVAGAVLLAIGT